MMNQYVNLKECDQILRVHVLGLQTNYLFQEILPKKKKKKKKFYLIPTLLSLLFIFSHIILDHFKMEMKSHCNYLFFHPTSSRLRDHAYLSVLPDLA